MTTVLTLPLAATVGFPWGNLVWVIVGITAFLFAVAGVGRWLAATHPDAVPRPAPVRSGGTVSSPGVSPEVTAVIAAAVHEALGASAQVTSVALKPEPSVSVDNLMLTWSLEGRRQIYTSHKVR